MLQGVEYIPLLHARLAELRALQELPASTKNLMIPIVSARPWLNSKSLDKLWDRLNLSIGARQFGLDLDETRYRPDDERESYASFCELFNPNNAYQAYYAKVGELEFAIPVLRRSAGKVTELDQQLHHIVELGRGAFVRLGFTDHIDVGLVAARIFELGIENIVFVIDCGWSPDLLGRANWATAQTENIVAVDPEFEIVVAGSSFPDSFSGIGERHLFPIHERFVFNEVRRSVNIADLFYGDWGSTRPPTEPIPMRSVPRIDLAQSSNWLSIRSEGNEDYEDLANRALMDEAWPTDVGIWATYMIESTAEGLEVAIKAPAAASAVRINFHLHYQATFNTPDALMVTDEPYVDDL